MRTYVLTMAYGSAPCFREGMKRFSETLTDTSDIVHIILDQHYPLRHKELQNEISVYKDSAPYPVHWFDAGTNLGLHDGLNYMLSHLPTDLDDALIVGLDPDENPHTAGWLKAMHDVMAADASCGWLSLMHPAARDYMLKQGHASRVISGNTVDIPPYPLINTVCGWRLSAIRKVGAFTEPHRWYGGLESAMMPRYTEAGYWTGWLRDFGVTNLHHLADPEYLEYKRHHVGHVQPVFPGSFDEWLARDTSGGS